MKKILFVAIMSFSSLAFAADDVLSILGGSGEKDAAGIKKEKTTEVSPFRAAFPNPTADQNIFFALLQSGETEKALLQYFEAFGKSNQASSANAQALLSYLFLKNDMTVFGVETLFSNVDPNKMSPQIAQAIRELLPDTHPVWKLARIQWQPKWTQIFSPSIEVQVKSKKVFTEKDVDALKDIIKVSAPNTRDRAAIQWQLVVALALSGDSVTAAKLLHNLMNTKENPVQPDLVSLTAARMLYENGYMDAAIKYYKQITTKSDFWLEAQEEMAWAFVRKGEPQNTLAITQGLVIPQFKNIVGPETVFLRTLAQLKVCDYPGVLKTLAMFRERYKPKTAEMLKVAENADTPATKEFIAKMKNKRLKLIELGPMAAKLPRLVTRDESLYQDILVEQALEKEAAVAMGIYGRSLAGGTSKVGMQGEIEIFKNTIEGRVTSARNASLGRLKALAQEEVADTHRLLQKLHIVEAEVMQQALVAQKVAAATSNSKAIEKKGSTGSEGRDKITFAANDGPIWFDEIAHYKVDVVKGCQAIKR